jgi:hypothetical protein
MARPPKFNADYFSHDNDMRNDDKIKAVRRKFGHEGYSIWNMMLEKLCKSSGFVLKYNDINIELWAGDFEVSPDILKEMIEYFLKVELLLFHDDMVFSETMIKRFNGLLSKRKRQTNELSTAKTPHKEVIANEKPQSKVKKSKVNNIEKNIIKESNEFLNVYGKETIEAFLRYWTETNKKGKQKWTLEKTWETKSRLATWKGNETKWAKTPGNKFQTSNGPGGVVI